MSELTNKLEELRQALRLEALAVLQQMLGIRDINGAERPRADWGRKNSHIAPLTNHTPAMAYLLGEALIYRGVLNSGTLGAYHATMRGMKAAGMDENEIIDAKKPKAFAA